MPFSVDRLSPALKRFEFSIEFFAVKDTDGRLNPAIESAIVTAKITPDEYKSLKHVLPEAHTFSIIDGHSLFMARLSLNQFLKVLDGLTDLPLEDDQ